MNENWYVLRTAPQKELRAAEALRDLGYTVFVPTVQKHHRIGRNSKSVVKKLEAYFPNYLFIRYWIPWEEMKHDSPRCIRDRSGNKMLVGAVTVCGRQEPIPEHVIGKIAEAAARLESDQNRPARILQEGDVCIIKSGAFEGRQGKITKLSKHDAAFAIFNAVREVRIRIDQLEAAE